jgi:hypothetical protein
MIAFRQLLLAALVVAAGPACSAGSELEAGPPTPSGVRGRIHVAIVVEDTGAASAIYLTGSARLLQYRGVDAETADILAGGELRSALERGSCQLAAADERLDNALASTPEGASVRHLDAGEMLVHAGDAAAGTIAPRHLPALFPYVTGVQYEELFLSEGLEQGLPDGAEVSVTAFGGEDVGPFNVIATSLPLVGRVRAELSGDLVVTWAPTAGASGAAAEDLPSSALDEHLIEIIVMSGGGGPEVRCRVPDSGRLAIGRELVDGLPGVEAVAVERVRRVPFRAPGLQQGELEVAVRHVVTEASR